MTILLETGFGIGDVVCHRTDTNHEEKFIVLAYYIMAVNESGETTMYNVDCSNGDGTMKSFRPYELTLIEKVNENK